MVKEESNFDERGLKFWYLKAAKYEMSEQRKSCMLHYRSIQWLLPLLSPVQNGTCALEKPTHVWTKHPSVASVCIKNKERTNCIAAVSEWLIVIYGTSVVLWHKPFLVLKFLIFNFLIWSLYYFSFVRCCWLDWRGLKKNSEQGHANIFPNTGQHTSTRKDKLFRFSCHLSSFFTI